MPLARKGARRNRDAEGSKRNPADRENPWSRVHGAREDDKNKEGRGKNRIVENKSAHNGSENTTSALTCGKRPKPSRVVISRAYTSVQDALVKGGGN